MKETKTKTAYIKYLAAVLLFGSNGVIASYISLTSYEIVLLRTLIGSLFLSALFLLTGGKFTFWQKKRQFIAILLSGMAMGGNWMFLYEAYRHIGVGMATLACYCGPVIVMVLSPLLFREKLTWPKLAGFAAVLIGVVLVNGKVMVEGGNGWGLFCGAMSALTYAALVILNKKARDITGLENATLQLIASFLTVAAFVWIRQGLSIQIEKGDWLPVLLLGMLNTGVGCYFYFSSIGRLPVQTVAICGYLEPVSAVFFAFLFLKEAMLPVQLLGAALILGGAAFGECYGGALSKKAAKDL
ncbi:MAG: DMT family transporter [Clostridia bacterium]|nr:DMT family transporter [Clostridia bacterium]